MKWYSRSFEQVCQSFDDLMFFYILTLKIFQYGLKFIIMNCTKSSLISLLVFVLSLPHLGYLPNSTLHNDFKIWNNRQGTKRYKKVHSKLSTYKNPLISLLFSKTLSENSIGGHWWIRFFFK